MAEKGVVFRPSFYEAMRYLKDKDQAALFRAICEYGFYDQKPEGLNPTLYGFFVLIQPVLDAACKRYNASVANGAKARKNAESTQENLDEPSVDQTATKEEPGINQDIDIDTDTDKDNNKNINIAIKTETETDTPPSAGKPGKKSTFVPPTKDEVEEYCLEMGIYIDAAHFLEHYKAAGWKEGNKPMKDWKAAVRAWHTKIQDRFSEKEDIFGGFAPPAQKYPWETGVKQNGGYRW